MGKLHRLSIEAFLEEFPQAKTKPVSVQLNLVFSDCQYEELVLLDNPFSDIVTYFIFVAKLNDEKITIRPDFENIVRRNTKESECGGLGIVFTLLGIQEHDIEAVN